MNRIIKYLSSFVLFTIVTKTYLVWANLLHTSVSTITTIVFVFLLFLLLYNLQNFKLKIPYRWLFPLALFVIVAPTIVSILTFNVNYKALSLQFFYFLVFLVAFLSYKRYGQSYIFKLILFSLLFTIFFGFLSVINPSFFLPYAQIINTLEFYGGRAVGFYLQANSLAFAINMMFIGIILLSPKEKYILYLYPLVFLIILITGSRSNFFGFAITSLFLFIYFFQSYRQIIFKVLMKLIPILLIVVLFSIDYVSKILHDPEHEAMFSRISMMLLQDDKGIKEDFISGSMAERISKQISYQKLIFESPIIGNGFGVQRELVEHNILLGAAHNTILEIILQGGLLYLSFYIYLIFKLINNYYFYKKKNKYSKRFILTLKVFIIFIMFYTFFTSTIFDERVIYVIFGLLAAASLNKKTIQRVTK